MKRLTTAVAVLALTASTAIAGGVGPTVQEPMIVPAQPEPAPRGSFGGLGTAAAVGIVAVGALALAAASSDDDDDNAPGT